MGKFNGPGETVQARGPSGESTKAGIKAALVDQPGSKSYQTAVDFVSFIEVRRLHLQKPANVSLGTCSVSYEF